MATIFFSVVLLTQLWGYEINFPGKALVYVILSALFDMGIYLWLLYILFVSIGLL